MERNYTGYFYQDILLKKIIFQNKINDKQTLTTLISNNITFK